MLGAFYRQGLQAGQGRAVECLNLKSLRGLNKNVFKKLSFTSTKDYIIANYDC